MYELRICVTLKCNYKCSYCSPDGEGIYSEKLALQQSELIEYIKLLTGIGVCSVRFTGGEPFCRKDFLELVRETKKIKGINHVSLVTNGSLLNKNLIDIIAKEDMFSYVSVSLDTLDREKYKQITKRDTYEKVIENIKNLRKNGVRTRINYVLTKENVGGIEDILEFCINEKIDIKVLDLYNNNSNYVDSLFVKEILEKKGFIFTGFDWIQGKLGTPMYIYRGHGITVILKDSNMGTIYSEISCKKCKRYPCQLGIVGPIMTHDGIVKVCNLGREKDINCFAINQIDKIKEVFDNVGSLSAGWNTKLSE